MKKKTCFKGILVLFVAVLLLIGECISARRLDPLFLFAFDDPFPATPFKHTLQICIQTWELLEDLKETGVANRSSYALFANAALGSCVRLQEALRVFADYQKKEALGVPVEDIIYLQVLIERVAQVQRTTGLQGDVDLLMSTILRDIGYQCDQMVLAF